MSWGDRCVKSWGNVPNSNPKPDIQNINVDTKFNENPSRFTQIIILKRKYHMSLADNSIKNWWNLPISYCEPDLHNINANTKFGKKSIHVCYHLETKIWLCSEQLTVQNWWNLPISNPKPDLCNINALTKFGENPLIFTQVIVWKRKIRYFADR